MLLLVIGIKALCVRCARLCAVVRLPVRLCSFLRSLFTTAQLTHSFETRVRPFLHLCTWVHVCVCECLFFYCSPSRIRFLIDLDRTHADLYCNGWNQGAIIIKVFFWHLLMSWLTLNFRHFQTPKATASSLHAQDGSFNPDLNTCWFLLSLIGLGSIITVTMWQTKKFQKWNSCRQNFLLSCPTLGRLGWKKLATW